MRRRGRRRCSRRLVWALWGTWIVSVAAPVGATPTRRPSDHSSAAGQPRRLSSTVAPTTATRASPAATRTIWAHSGARSWSQCGEKAREASLLQAPTRVAEELEEHRWGGIARDCPHSIEILRLAAETEMQRAFLVPTGTDGSTDLSALDQRHGRSRDRALAWVNDAIAESQRRGEPTPEGLDFLRGNVLLSAARYDEADRAYRQALTGNGIEPYRVRRLQALVALFRGDIDEALRSADRAMIDTPSGPGHMTSRYILALVLERSGDPAAAVRVLSRTLSLDGDRSSFSSLLLVLPIHERLYLEALKAEALADEPQARRLWAAYLARPQPEVPERRLAERHLAELQILPDRLVP